MKRFLSGLLAFSTVLVLLLTVIPVQQTSAAADFGHAKRWNIMLVVDASGSMDRVHTGKTDPDGLRFEAVGSFLSILQDDGHKIGAIAFDAAEGKQDTMEGAIAGEYPLTSLDENKNAKDEIMDMLQQTNPNQSGRSTDIGSALLYALNKLEAERNSNPCAIFLFTDGKTAVPPAHQAQSDMNRDLAIEKIQNWNGEIEICGVYLNADNSASNNPAAMGIKEIIRQALQVSGEDPRLLGNSYREITDAFSCVASTDAFLQLLGYSMGDINGQSNGSKEFDALNPLSDEFVVPGCGVEEVNIRLHVNSSTKLPDIEMYLIDPEGNKIYSTDSDRVKVDSMDTYYTWKVTNPMPGQWQVLAWVRGGSDASITYTPFFSSNIDAKMSIEPTKGQMYMNQDLQIAAWLEAAGVKYTDPSDYVGYTCELNVSKRQPDGSYVQHATVVLPLQNGCFDQTVPVKEYANYLGYGTYRVTASFKCNILNISSGYVDVILENNPPVLKQSSVEESVNYGLFQKKEVRFDLSQYFSDPEEDEQGTPLSFSIEQAGNCDENGLRLEDTELVVNAKVAGDGDLTIVATDSQGSAAAPLSFELRVKDVTVPILIGIAVAVVVILVIAIIAAIIIGNFLNTLKPNGDCILTANIQGKEVEFLLTAPGVEGKRKDTLHGMITKALSGRTWTRETIASACAKAGLTVNQLEDEIRNDAKVLQKVRVSVTYHKRLVKLLVKYGGGKYKLYNSSVPVNCGENTYTFTYSQSENGESEFRDSFSFGSSAPAASESEWDDMSFDAAPAKEQHFNSSRSKSFGDFGSSSDSSGGFGGFGGGSNPGSDDFDF